MIRDVLQLQQFAKPTEAIEKLKLPIEQLPPGYVRVVTQAAPINPADINYIHGTYGIQPQLPTTIGIEGAGTVIESNSIDFTMGDQVIFVKRVGTWQSHINCPADALVKLKSPIDPLQAAMLKVNPMTAWRLLTSFRKLSEGDYIVQNAANSGVGQCVIQIAKQLGLKTINLVRREELLEPLTKLGATHTLLDNKDAKAKIAELIGAENSPKLALNAVGGDSGLRLMDIVADQGHHVTYGAMSMRSLKLPNKFLIFKRITLQGLWITKDLEEMPRTEVEQIYQKLARWVSEGKLSQAIEKTYRLCDYETAIEHAQQSKRSGKILFQI